MYTHSLKIITSKKEWNFLLSEIINYDFYHTYDYHNLSASDNETPIMIHYKEGDMIIAIPFLLRKIFNTEYNDLTSVYGYSGPICKNINQEFDQTHFIKVFNEYLLENNIVSVFSRLNPFIPFQDTIITGIGEQTSLSKVITIDLTGKPEEQRAAYSRTTKRYINKGRKICSIKKSNSKEDLLIFKELYFENMKRVNAKDFYFFDKDYFLKFASSTDFETEILFAVLNETNEVISAAMMIKCNNIIQYHISGTRDKYLHLTPIRLLIDEMRLMGNNENYTYFNLGGGLGSTEDSLFSFKASFSKNFKEFKIWKFIVNPKIYEQLNDEFSDTENNTSFFPLYRNKTA